VNASDPVAEEQGLIGAMFALRRLMLSGEQFRHAVAAHFGVGLSETVAMSHLSAAGSLTPREVANKVGLTPSTVTALLDRLEAAGLATRAAHPTDRRKSVITITDRGREMLVQVQEWMRAALSELRPDRLPDTVTALTELATALDAQAAEIRGQTAVVRR
jgi:DNA-binding MarR family transcriptional regulator